MDTNYGAQPTSDIDVCRMFDQYLYKRGEGGEAPLQNSYFSNGYTSTPHQTFLPPNFGEEFEIPPLNPTGGNGSTAAVQTPYNHSLLMGLKRSSDAMSAYQHQSQLYTMNSPINPRSPYLGAQAPGGQASYNALHMLQHGYNNMATSVNKSTSPKGEQHSEDSDDSHGHLVPGMKRPSPEPTENGLSKLQKKPKPQKKKKKKDPNEPQKPVSAYALFFRDTQAAIKGQNPNASFGEVSKIVASMWDSLDVEHKNLYKKKTEAAKKDYLKALAAYRASLVSKGGNENESAQQTAPPPPVSIPYPHGPYPGGYGAVYGGYSPPAALPSPPSASTSPQAAKKPNMMSQDSRNSHQQAMMNKHMSQSQQSHQQKHQQTNLHQPHQQSNEQSQQHLQHIHHQQSSQQQNHQSQQQNHPSQNHQQQQQASQAQQTNHQQQNHQQQNHQQQAQSQQQQQQQQSNNHQQQTMEQQQQQQQNKSIDHQQQSQPSSHPQDQHRQHEQMLSSHLPPAHHTSYLQQDVRDGAAGWWGAMSSGPEGSTGGAFVPPPRHHPLAPHWHVPAPLPPPPHHLQTLFPIPTINSG